MVGNIVKNFRIINKKDPGIIEHLDIIFMDRVVMMKLKIDCNNLWNS